jgi:hypothetical protein
MTDPGHWGHRFPAPHGKAVVLPPPCCSGGDRISHGDQRLAAWSVIRRLLTGQAVTPEDLRSGGAASCLQPGATWLAAGWCHPSASGDPVFIPHDVEKRGVLTRIDPEPNSQVSDPFPPPPQVTDSAGSASQGGVTGSNPVGTTSKAPGRRPVGSERSLKSIVRPACVPRKTVTQDRETTHAPCIAQWLRRASSTQGR